jgi:hypothetical protein
LKGGNINGLNESIARVVELITVHFSSAEEIEFDKSVPSSKQVKPRTPSPPGKEKQAQNPVVIPPEHYS